uniref:Uncharacterized protein n=1 Tax=Arundo donax TaxID=35708 RepID=A0A0A9HRQ2_ARUDO
MLISHVKFPELQINGRYGSHLGSRTKQTIHSSIQFQPRAGFCNTAERYIAVFVLPVPAFSPTNHLSFL